MLETGASERQLIEPSANVRVDAARDKSKCEGRAYSYRKQKTNGKTESNVNQNTKENIKQRRTEKNKTQKTVQNKLHTQTRQTCKLKTGK